MTPTRHLARSCTLPPMRGFHRCVVAYASRRLPSWLRFPESVGGEFSLAADVPKARMRKDSPIGPSSPTFFKRLNERNYYNHLFKIYASLAN
ncbi:hypothetical protein EVAR_20071_1 [Eumeta japonica]|uniref:Uncharacterized protein n=1 Tax=Eumeta variegata TaxID=151549 RepID=A0A4C1UIY4_EUMVA|nr:hypothetical protein EVAR_20071_1 [Eumeta japonica]